MLLKCQARRNAAIPLIVPVCHVRMAAFCCRRSQARTAPLENRGCGVRRDARHHTRDGCAPRNSHTSGARNGRSKLPARPSSCGVWSKPPSFSKRSVRVCSFDGGIDSSTLAVAENQDEWRAEHGDGVFKAGDRIDVSEIAGNTADKEISATGVKGVFGSGTRICASQNSGERILSEGQCRTFGNEIVTFHFSFHVAIVSFHEALKGSIRCEHVFRFGRGVDLRGLRSSRKTEAQCGSACKLEKIPAAKIRRTAR